VRWWVPIVTVPPLVGLLVILGEFRSGDVPPDLWWDYALAAGLCGLASVFIPTAIMINRWKYPAGSE
jgi:hypothetical protein